MGGPISSSGIKVSYNTQSIVSAVNAASKLIHSNIVSGRTGGKSAIMAQMAQQQAVGSFNIPIPVHNPNPLLEIGVALFKHLRKHLRRFKSSLTVSQNFLNGGVSTIYFLRYKRGGKQVGVNVGNIMSHFGSSDSSVLLKYAFFKDHVLLEFSRQEYQSVRRDMMTGVLKSSLGGYVDKVLVKYRVNFADPEFFDKVVFVTARCFYQKFQNVGGAAFGQRWRAIAFVTGSKYQNLKTYKFDWDL